MATGNTSSMFGSTTSGIPIAHLDYAYIGKCTNGPELEKILKVLRSGEEGNYPDLIEFAEKRLEGVAPKSKSLRKNIPIQSYNDLENTEKEQITEDFEEWFTDINQKDTLLKENRTKNTSNDDFLPPIRSTKTVGSSTSSSAQVTNEKRCTENKKKGPFVPRGYQDWDKFNPDEELKTMEEKEENELKRKKEKAKINSKEAEVPTDIETAGKTTEELSFLANNEKNKGNEAFHSGDYQESLVYYSRSIKLKPTAASYNNRAFAELKLEKYREAIQDCTMVIELEPNNLKAFLRRAIAFKCSGESANARHDLNKVLDIEPNNKRAKELLTELSTERIPDEDAVRRPRENGDVKRRGKRMEIIEIDNDDDGDDDDDDDDDKKQGDHYNGTNTTSTSVHQAQSENLENDQRQNSVTMETKAEDADINKHENVVTLETSEAEVADINEPENAVTMETSNADAVDIKKETDTSKGTGVVAEEHRAVPVVVKSPPAPMVELPAVVSRSKDEGNSLYKLGRFAEAAEKYTSAVDVLAKDQCQYQSALASLLYNRAACLHRIGDSSGCIDDCNAALVLIPGVIKPLLKRAAAQETLEKFEGSYLDYNSAFQIDSNNTTAMEGRSRVSKHLYNIHGYRWRNKLEAQSSSTATSEELLKSEKVNDDEESINIIPSNNSNIAGQKKMAAPEPSPTQSVAEKFEKCKEKGNAFVKQGKLDQAVSCYTDCINLDPEQVAIYTNRALCYLRLQKYDLAERDSSKALELQADNVKALYRRALARKGMRKYDDAAKDLLTLIKTDPNNTSGKKELDVVLNLCREERREKQKASEESNKTNINTANGSAKSQDKIKVEPKAARRRRVKIEEVNGEDSDEDVRAKPSPSKKPPSPCPAKSSNNKDSVHPSMNKPSVSSTTSNKEKKGQPQAPTASPTKEQKRKKIKLNKATAFEFSQAWNSVKQKDPLSYADILRQIQPALLPKVISNKLDADMFRSIIGAVSEHILPNGDEKLSFEILQHVGKAQRFAMALMFLNNNDTRVLRELFSTLSAARAKSGFVKEDTFNNVLRNYKV